ncbi:2-hydroxychromene-2-carboxylate isomerase [Telluria aromaticivorans]|uniref:2-hydroxychromene-2-carboxylate isomerase n=1 Tax=Telluria aromaticivorans TaxID=2725995 RepID=A0A7Y2P0G7_9BURK|nr:2-hydroxychromene-2-carboxylate isomerase [Telluria aromaticivorans]NNG24178.1 2-hydroxychromene-2-carboxylate isomerase [Telluria aromaticivorans]
MHPPIEFWFEFGSNYSYLSLMRIEALADRAGVPLSWRPFLLGPIFRELGYQSSPFNEQKEKGEYAWRDMERRAAKYGLPFKRPSVFPRPALLPMRVALLGADQPWMGEYCRRIMLQNWVHDRDIDNADVVLAALAGLVDDPAAIVAEAGSERTKLLLRAQTANARDHGIFGAPTFMVYNEMFWGDDRLEDALEWAQACPAP